MNVGWLRAVGFVVGRLISGVRISPICGSSRMRTLWSSYHGVCVLWLCWIPCSVWWWFIVLGASGLVRFVPVWRYGYQLGWCVWGPNPNKCVEEARSVILCLIPMWWLVGLSPPLSMATAECVDDMSCYIHIKIPLYSASYSLVCRFGKVANNHSGIDHHIFDPIEICLEVFRSIPLRSSLLERS